MYWDAPADDYERLLNMLAIEGEVAHAHEGLEPGEELYGYGPDGYTDDPFSAL